MIKKISAVISIKRVLECKDNLSPQIPPPPPPTPYRPQSPAPSLPIPYLTQTPSLFQITLSPPPSQSQITNSLPLSNHFKPLPQSQTPSHLPITLSPLPPIPNPLPPPNHFKPPSLPIHSHKPPPPSLTIVVGYEEHLQ